MNVWTPVLGPLPLPTVQRVVFGATAGLVGQSITYPLDIVRRRMQVSSGDQYSGIWTTFRQILMKEGTYYFPFGVV